MFIYLYIFELNYILIVFLALLIKLLFVIVK